MGLFSKSCSGGGYLKSSCSGGVFKKSCATLFNPNVFAPAPSPLPSRWSLLETHQYINGYVLVVRYHDCTNFEGVKAMVYKGTYHAGQCLYLDPHFTDSPDAPIARFRPDDEGLAMAKKLARSL